MDWGESHTLYKYKIMAYKFYIVYSLYVNLVSDEGQQIQDHKKFWKVEDECTLILGHLDSTDN